MLTGSRCTRKILAGVLPRIFASSFLAGTAKCGARFVLIELLCLLTILLEHFNE